MRSTRRKEVEFTSTRHGRHEYHIEKIEEIEIEIAEASEVWGWYWYDVSLKKSDRRNTSELENPILTEISLPRSCTR